jgi:hypothetical protein
MSHVIRVLRETAKRKKVLTLNLCPAKWGDKEERVMWKRKTDGIDFDV